MPFPGCRPVPGRRGPRRGLPTSVFIASNGLALQVSADIRPPAFCGLQIARAAEARALSVRVGRGPLGLRGAHAGRSSRVIAAGPEARTLLFSVSAVHDSLRLPRALRAFVGDACGCHAVPRALRCRSTTARRSWRVSCWEGRFGASRRRLMVVITLLCAMSGRENLPSRPVTGGGQIREFRPQGEPGGATRPRSMSLGRERPA